jgi:hypothetical protein
MKIPPLPAVDCAILHERHQPMDGRRLFDAISVLAAKYGLGARCNLTVTSTEKDIHVLVGDHRILVSQNAKPLGPDGFRMALTSPFTGMIFPGAREAVARHQANTFVTVGKGPIGVPEDVLYSTLGKVMAEEWAFTTSEEASAAMALCRDLTDVVIKGNPASAIHWCVSDNLVPQAYFERAVAASDLTLLAIRPYLTSSAGRLGEGLPVGVTANGSQWLLGKMVAIDEAPVPVPWLLSTLNGFINLCLIRSSLIADKDTFSVEEQDWQIGVFHEKIDGFDRWEVVRLKILHCPKYGIHGRVATMRTFEYKSVEDVRQRANEEKHEIRAANDLPETTPNFVNTAGVHRVGDVARLRSLALSSAANRDNAGNGAGVKGLVMRFLSLFLGPKR